MRIPHGPGGFVLFGGIFTDILAGLVFIILFVVAVGLLFVLVRFLLVATKAAELYISRNSSTLSDAAPSEPTTKPTTTTTTTPRTRTTKTPPTTE
jgi:cytoskeletal protein RodZ